MRKRLWEDNMNYNIICGKREDLDKAEIAYINDVPWGSTYTPECGFQGIFIPEEGFLFRLFCVEKNPRITYLEPGGEVCEDSCLELFLNFAPEKSKSYINFEMNAAGAYQFGIGPDRYDRVEMNTPHMPTVKAEILEDKWQVTLFIPLKAIEAVYGKNDFAKGYTITGNAFKCGDLTESEHYLTWAPVQRDAMDFHRSDRFGTFTIIG